MKPKKIILLSSIAILSLICVLQAVMSLHNPVKTFKMEQNPDKIIINQKGSEIVFTKETTKWNIGSNGFFANQADIDSIIKNLKEIKILDKVGTIKNAAIEEQYELSNQKAIIVSAYQNNKELITLKIGKTSSTQTHSFITINNKNDIYLASTNLLSIFGKTENDMISKTIYSISGNSITSVDITSGARTWGVKKQGNEEWTLTGASPKIIIDNDLTDAWIQSLAFLNATEWKEDSTKLPSNIEQTITINTDNDSIVINIYKEIKGTETEYICTSNKTPHKFLISSLSAEKYLNAQEEIINKEE